MPDDLELPIRITVVRPAAGVTFAVQRGRDGLLPPTRASDGELRFDLSLRIAERGGEASLRGPFAQGPPSDRFVYVNSGTRAGQADSRWTRRAKVKTAGIGRRLIDETLAAPGAVLEARIEGTSSDGGPCCATVPLLDGGWRVARG
jgi:hypothetical protein